MRARRRRVSAGLSRLRQHIEVYYSMEINLERARPGTPAAVRTVEKVKSVLARALGFLVNVDHLDGPPTVEWLLDGNALARYISYLMANRCVQRPGCSLQA